MVKIRKNALKIGGISITAYLVSYLLRNILSVLTPQMLKTASYTKESIALFSSVYFIVYASGQLINGIIGDIVKPRIMVFTGLMVSGLPLLVFPLFKFYALQILCFAFMGFGLSMLRGPLVKVISENTEEKYARICCVLLSFAAFTGPLFAGVLAMLLPWRAVFAASGIISCAMAFISYAVLYHLEKKNIIVPHKSSGEKKGFKDIAAIFRLDKFIIYMFIGMIIEISSSSISFWIPTYISEPLGFPSNMSGMLYSVISFVRAFAPFLAIFLFSLFRNKAMRMMRVMFLLAAAGYSVMLFVGNRWIQMILIIVALTTASCAGAVMWSIYIPSLGKSGKVSGANGILDCAGYVAASASNSVFAGIMSSFGWNGIIITWGIVMLIGALITMLQKE